MTPAQGTAIQFFGLLTAIIGYGFYRLWLAPPARRWKPHTHLAQLITHIPGDRKNTPIPTPHPQRAKLADGRRWLLVGAPGTGKSTAARGLIRALMGAGATVTILDPDGSAWPDGARMVGAPDDYSTIGKALDQLQTLAGERRAQFQRGARRFDPILIVIDEAPSVLKNTPGAIDTVADLARRGRKLSISIILLAQDTQARTLGIEGQTKLLDAFDRLDCRMTPAGVELLEGGIVRTVIALDYDARDLVLPMVEDAPPPAAPRRVESVEPVEANRLLRNALGIDGSNAATPFASAVVAIASPQTDPIKPIAQPDVATLESAESLPPDVAQRIAGIDWRTVAELVEVGALGETAALKALGFPASSTSMKYQAARGRLQAARAALRETSKIDSQTAVR